VEEKRNLINDVDDMIDDNMMMAISANDRMSNTRYLFWQKKRECVRERGHA